MTDPERFDTSMQPVSHEAKIAAESAVVEPSSPPQTDEPSRRFEDLTLAEVVGQFWRAPQGTVRALREIARTPRSQPTPVLEAQPLPQAAVPVRSIAPGAPAVATDESRREAFQLGIRFTAFLVAWWGNGIMANAPVRTESLALDAGAPFLLVAFLLWIVGDLYGEWPALKTWWAQRGAAKAAEPTGEPAESGGTWAVIHPVRILMALSGVFFSLLAFRFNVDNQFTFVGFWSWVISILLWVGALAPASWGWRAVQAAWPSIRDFDWRKSWTFWALVVITLLAASMRLTHVPDVPPEMTSDHVEKILDSQRVLDGNHEIFFPNNGGREGVQMYAMALFSQLPGMSMDFTTLKLLTGVEGIIAVLLMYWLGRSLFEENKRLGNLVGLMIAALVAVSYWHTALSRLGLRIVLTTIVTTLLLLYLARAMRHNRRGDYIKAGLVLGFGLYTYQAVRMLPVVIIVGVGLAFLFAARNWRMRGHYAWNFIVLVVIAFVVFLPLFGYWLEYPEDFWRRTSGRLLGDDLIQETQEDGTIITRDATIQERLAAFNENLPILTNNFRNALLMFNWKGDVAWINAAPNRPALDSFTGALFIVGLAAWL
ncbi:MAG: glycosyltransferase family 39 protein, partial [Anaerolineae bacterium]|nr:glycosyltransferase family 39 protein [Anaerolineae bacterium]